MATFTILEPMSTGDVIDRAVRLYRRNFTPLLAITAVPTMIGLVVSLMFWNGYTSLITSAASNSEVFPVAALVMLILGGLGYPIWLYVLLLTVSGMSRVVGDHLMAGETITFRGCWTAIRKRLGAITLMALLSVLLFFVAYIVLSIVLFIVILAVTLLIGVLAAAGLPQWVTTVTMSVIVIAGVALSLLVICVVVARVVFLPQVVMIEGQSAANALGRAIGLGKGNWYRVGAISLFTYFVSASVLAALTLPVLTALYFWDVLNAEFFVGPTWSILYTSFGQVSNLLSFPIWIVSFTLLYFDSRVRKEAYDVDLLAREINPGFYWQPAAQPSVYTGQPPTQSSSGRAFVQTSPLGLAGYRPPPPASVTLSETNPAEGPRSESEELRDKFERAAKSLGEAGDAPAPDGTVIEAVAGASCKECGETLMQHARFCMRCGTVVETT